MNPPIPLNAELFELLEALCEQRLSTHEMRRLEELVTCDRDARRTYLQFIDMHGTLYWDTAIGAGTEIPLSAPADSDNLVPVGPLDTQIAPALQTRIPARSRQGIGRWVSFELFQNRSLTALVLTALGLVVYVGVRAKLRSTPERRNQIVVLDEDRGSAAADLPAGSRSRDNDVQRDSVPMDDSSNTIPLEMDQWASANNVADSTDTAPGDGQALGRPSRRPAAQSESKVVRVAPPLEPPAIENLVEYANVEIRKGWREANLEPSPVADDAEWIRRIYLDALGHIPAADRVVYFLADQNVTKRHDLVEELLENPDYVQHLANNWTNLLIGRSETADVDRSALEGFLRDSFSRNRPWSDIVADLISAEGDNHENGATNFLLAHLNNQAVPATAITSRVLMGVQIQCTQCHNHPFNDQRQERFWELNSFFQQTARVVHIEPRPGSNGLGKMRRVELVSRGIGGPSFFETLKGVTSAVYPKFGGMAVDPGPGTNRRRELAKLMTRGERPLIAVAMVNRTWEQFFGYGFTQPVDDIGPHNPPTHAALLDRLAKAFVQSGFDIKQLVRWIVDTEAYQLTSRIGESNQLDQPHIGETPVFSRMYIKPMTAEQLYDSLIVATKGDQSETSWSDMEQNRQRWLRQFITVYETEENNEVTNFEGTVSQALMMMNSELIQDAIDVVPGNFLSRLLADKGATRQKIERLFLTTLSRYPSQKELDAATRLIRQRTRRGSPEQRTPQVASQVTLQDLFWAALNSNEFILNH